MPKQDARQGSGTDEQKNFRGEFARLEREYVLARSILAARQSVGMTKGAFAKAVGTSKGKVSRWESADAVPRLEMLQRIANVTGITFQIGIVPLEDPASSGASSGGSSDTAGRKRSTRKTATTSPQRKGSSRRSRAGKSTTRKSSGRKSSSKRSTAGKTSTRKSASTSTRKRAARRSSSGGRAQT